MGCMQQDVTITSTKRKIAPPCDSNSKDFLKY